MTVTRYKPQQCFNCDYVMDACVAVQERDRPKDGDVALCLRCGYTNIYNADLTFRRPTLLERDRFASDANIRTAQRMIAAVNKSWPHR